MKKIAFTLCSNNYLAHAKTLADSLLATNPDIKFVIGLVDKINSEIDYSFLEPSEILPYDKIDVDFFEAMITKYNIIEFNTAVKPFYFSFLFDKYGSGSIVYYLDPDLKVFSSFYELNEKLLEYDFLITPHITTPRLEITPYETLFLNVGIYNLGFIGMRSSENTRYFLQWWQNRLIDHCYMDHARGLFVDQIWVNYINVLFKNVYIVMSPAYNMAHWNFYERVLLDIDGKFFVNDTTTPLVFFHFSGFNPTRPELPTKDKKTSSTFERRPDLVRIFRDYAAQLKHNNFDKICKVAPMLPFRPRRPKLTRQQKLGHSIKARVNKYITAIFKI